MRPDSTQYVVRATLYQEPTPVLPVYRPTRHHVPKPEAFIERLDWLDRRIEFYTRMVEARRRNPVPPEHAHKLKIRTGSLAYELELARTERDRLIADSRRGRVNTPPRARTRRATGGLSIHRPGPDVSESNEHQRIL